MRHNKTAVSTVNYGKDKDDRRPKNSMRPRQANALSGTK